MHGKARLVALSLIVCVGLVSNVLADIGDTTNISDGAAKGQASDGIISPGSGYGAGQDTSAGLPYYYQYFTDSDPSATTNSVIVYFTQQVPGSTTYTHVFEEFTGYSTTTFANIGSHISITNDNPAGGDALNLSDVHFFTSPTLIPLDSLNDPVLPPSNFTPLPSLDERLAPGATTPLPTSAWMGLTGIAGLAISRLKRNRGQTA